MKIRVEKIDTSEWDDFGEITLFPTVKYVRGERDDLFAFRWSFGIWNAAVVITK